MSALDQKQTYAVQNGIVRFGPIAGVDAHDRNIRFLPKGEKPAGAVRAGTKPPYGILPGM